MAWYLETLVGRSAEGIGGRRATRRSGRWRPTGSSASTTSPATPTTSRRPTEASRSSGSCPRTRCPGTRGTPSTPAAGTSCSSSRRLRRGDRVLRPAAGGPRARWPRTPTRRGASSSRTRGSTSAPVPEPLVDADRDPGRPRHAPDRRSSTSGCGSRSPTRTLVWSWLLMEKVRREEFRNALLRDLREDLRPLRDLRAGRRGDLGGVHSREPRQGGAALLAPSRHGPSRRLPIRPSPGPGPPTRERSTRSRSWPTTTNGCGGWRQPSHGRAVAARPTSSAHRVAAGDAPSLRRPGVRRGDELPHRRGGCARRLPLRRVAADARAGHRVPDAGAPRPDAQGRARASS